MCKMYNVDSGKILIDGNDIMECGFVGTEIGIVLSKLLKIVHKNRNYNTYSNCTSHGSSSAIQDIISSACPQPNALYAA